MCAFLVVRLHNACHGFCEVRADVYSAFVENFTYFRERLLLELEKHSTISVEIAPLKGGNESPGNLVSISWNFALNIFAEL